MRFSIHGCANLLLAALLFSLLSPEFTITSSDGVFGRDTSVRKFYSGKEYGVSARDRYRTVTMNTDSARSHAGRGGIARVVQPARSR